MIFRVLEHHVVPRHFENRENSPNDHMFLVEQFDIDDNKNPIATTGNLYIPDEVLLSIAEYYFQTDWNSGGVLRWREGMYKLFQRIFSKAKTL